MKYDIIKVDNYLLATGNDKKRGWFYCVRTKSFFHDEGEDVLCCNGDLSVDAHLHLNGADVIENLPLLPLLEQEEDVKNLAYKESVKVVGQHEDNTFTRYGFQDGFEHGYNKAKEKYKYTEEDMRKCWDACKRFDRPISEGYAPNFNEFIQSLSQPKMPTHFEFETIVLRERPTDIRNHIYDKTYEVPKTTTNSQGQTVWIGKYIY